MTPPNPRKKAFYANSSAQVLFAVAAAIALGCLRPAAAIAMKPLGDAFIRLITMIITLVIFCTVVTGIAGMEDLKKVGRVGGKALLYFELVSTLALFIGLAAGNIVHPGSAFNVNAAKLDARAVAEYAGQAKAQSVSEFLMHIIPNTVVDAFSKGDILQVLLVSVLFGFALSAAGPRSKPLLDFFNLLTETVFGVVSILMRFAPIGAFGALAFTIGKYGLASLGPLAKLIGTFYVTSILFIFIVLGVIARVAGFGILRFLAYIKEEILLVLAISSSEPAMPTLMAKLEKLGCSKGLVGLVVPTGYTFNTDGTSMYMTLAALFVAQATNTPLTLTQELTIFAVAVLTSKGASGVQGAAFIALVATMTVIPTIPVAGMALILGIDRFMSMCRATVNMIGNGVATVVVSRWEKELSAETLRNNLA
ncbi:MAG: dicarboxylate symporter family protein [Candidatus Acidoferrum typicum]|jgi:aerobic C4-dicarboxylate transport protein|nr:dicarboxylate symporter family protein [Candidatus Acidoferrum typicum]